MLSPAHRINTGVRIHVTFVAESGLWIYSLPVLFTQEHLIANLHQSLLLFHSIFLRTVKAQSLLEEKGSLQKCKRLSGGAAQFRRVVVLHGPGGNGRTQLAIEYAQRHREDYSVIVWIDAADEMAMNQSFARLATWILNYGQSANYILMRFKSKDQGQIVEAVKIWFDEPANNSWPIIYDNHRHPDPSIVDTKAANTSIVPKENASRTDSISPSKVASRKSFDIRR